MLYKVLIMKKIICFNTYEFIGTLLFQSQFQTVDKAKDVGDAKILRESAMLAFGFILHLAFLMYFYLRIQYNRNLCSGRSIKVSGVLRGNSLSDFLSVSTCCDPFFCCINSLLS